METIKDNNDNSTLVITSKESVLINKALNKLLKHIGVGSGDKAGLDSEEKLIMIDILCETFKCGVFI